MLGLKVRRIFMHLKCQCLEIRVPDLSVQLFIDDHAMHLIKENLEWIFFP